MKRSSYIQLSLIISGLFVFLYGCSKSTEIMTTPTRILVASTSAPTQTTTPTKSITSTLTRTPSPIPSSTSTPTQTPQPTLTTEEARTLVMDLLQNNGGCQLPCWWGFTPGQTTWDEARSFLERFASIEFYDNRNAYVYIQSPAEVPYITTLNQTYSIRGGIIETIDTYNFELASWYYLPNILTTYGQPDEVGIQTFRNEFNNSWPFTFSLFYLDRGILIEYAGFRCPASCGESEVVDDKRRFCPQGMTYNFIYLWNPAHQKTYDEAVNTFLDTQNMPYPIKLVDATGMDVATFYETFKDANTISCLETPLDLWPIY